MEWVQLIRRKNAIFLNAVRQLATDVSTQSVSCHVPVTVSNTTLVSDQFVKHTELRKYRRLQVKSDKNMPNNSTMTTTTTVGVMSKLGQKL